MDDMTAQISAAGAALSRKEKLELWKKQHKNVTAILCAN
jgi:hypothetical protein